MHSSAGGRMPSPTPSESFESSRTSVRNFVTGVHEEKNLREKEIDRNLVIQRNLIQSFREFFTSSIQRYCAQAAVEALPFVAMSRHNSALTAERMLDTASDIRVVFTIAEAGDDRVCGQWRMTVAGSDDLGPAEYVRVIDSKLRIYRDVGSKEWRLTTGDATGISPRQDEKILYKVACIDEDLHAPPPSSGWLSVVGSAPAPRLRETKTFDYFEIFTLGWRQDPPHLSGYRVQSSTDPRSVNVRGGVPHWSVVRGPYGESVLTWLWIMRARDRMHAKLGDAYKSIIMGIIHTEPKLAGVRMDTQPYLGESVLHHACAAGDVEMVSALVNNAVIRNQEFFQRDLLEGRFYGSFLHEIHKVPQRLSKLVDLATPPDTLPEFNGKSPLEVACVAPKRDEDAQAIVQLLIKAGAEPIYRDSSKGEVRYTILHVVAKSSWWQGWEYASHMSRSRAVAIISMFLDPNGNLHSKWGSTMISLPNACGHTPLQVAAMFGNEACFIEMLDCVKVPVWEWGKKMEVGFPLVELDSGNREAEVCALEFMTLYKHGNLLKLGIMADIVNKKWERFGKLWVQRFVVVQLISIICTGLVCLDDTVGYSVVRYTCRNIVLTISVTFCVLSAVLFVLCARNKEWFHRMDASLVFKDPDRVNVWSLLAWRNIVELVLMGVIVISPPWYAHEKIRDDLYYRVIWHSFASAWFLMMMVFSLRYFELFRPTSAMALTIPTILERDILPFATFYLVILFCSAMSLRISCEFGEHHGFEADHEFGSFKATLFTLEEAIHGPDVQWRNAVEHHPRSAGCIFVFFLWTTLIMMSILIAMFSSTFDEMRSTVTERLLFRRALFCVTLEKIFPQWYHAHSSWGPDGCQIGHALGGGAQTDDGGELDVATDSEQTDAEAQLLAGDGPSSGRGRAASYGTMTSNVRLSTKAMDVMEGREADRWLLWSGGEDTFDMWKQPYETSDILYGHHL